MGVRDLPQEAQDLQARCPLLHGRETETRRRQEAHGQELPAVDGVHPRDGQVGGGVERGLLQHPVRLPVHGPGFGPALQPPPDHPALRVRCHGGVLEPFESQAVDRSQMEGLMDRQDRLLGGYHVQVVTGGVPALSEHGVVVTETDDPIRAFPHLTFGELAELALEGRDVGDVAVGSGEEIGDRGL